MSTTCRASVAANIGILTPGSYSLTNKPIKPVTLLADLDTTKKINGRLSISLILTS
jgi:hypothetical protein